MAKKTKTTEEEIDAGAVLSFERTQRELEELEAENPEIFKKLRDISERYNSLLDYAHKYVRNSGQSSGPFIVTSKRTAYDGEKLFNLLGETEFRAIGGEIRTKTEYAISSQNVAKAVVEQKLEEDAAAAFQVTTLTIKRPGPLEIP